MLWHRVLSALVGIPVILAAVWAGGIPLLVFTGLLLVLGLSELTGMLKRMELRPSRGLAIFGGLILLAGTYISGEREGSLVTLIIVLNLLAIVFWRRSFSPVDAATTIFCTFYVGLIVYVYLLRSIPEGLAWLLLLLACTWASDTMAYFAGRKFGRVRLAPDLSPGKTVEGAAGGVLGSIVAALIVAQFYPQLPWLHLLILGFLVGLVGQLGDLVESALKRQTGVKDAGTLIPGHGGIMDRFDSMLLTAPLVYYYVGLFIMI
ncbi:MAG: phosphatidate cytidylyltransferase [Bacillota bacterium]